MAASYGVAKPLQWEWIEAAVFAGFLVISLLFELALHALEHRLKHKGRSGLLAFVQGLKTEVLLYGLLSLLLSVVQPALAKICIKPGGQGGGEASYQNQTAGNATAADHGRRLLAEYTSQCPDGKVQVLSYKTAHNIHVLIFMVAISHIFLSLLSLTLCLLKVRRWKKWADAPEDEMEPLSEKVLRGLGSNRCTHWLRSFFGQYFMGVNKAVFLGVRGFFLEQLMSAASLDQLFNFPFYNFLVFSTEHHMARLVSLDWFVWLFAVVLLLLPMPWQKPALYAWTALSGLLLMICGTKMQSSVVHMASKAHFQNFYDPALDSKDVTGGGLQPPADQRVKKSEADLKHRLKRIQTTRELFWFRKPTVFIMMYKMAYFQVAFALAYLLYKAVVDKEKTDKLLDTYVLDGALDNIKEVVPFFSGTAFLLVLLGLVLILIVHSSWAVLPMYSLCMTTSKDAQKDIRNFLEMLKSHEWVDRPASAYLAHELQRSETLQRLATTYEDQGDGPTPAPAPAPYNTTADAAIDVAYIGHVV